MYIYAKEAGTEMTADEIMDEVWIEGGYTVRWKSNGKVPPKECMDTLLEANLITDTTYNWSARTRDYEMEKDISEYVAWRTSTPYTEEELVEIRANLGEDAVDVFTGKKIG